MAKPSSTNSPKLSYRRRIDSYEAEEGLPEDFTGCTAGSKDLNKEIKVVIARGIHLFPFRTEKLSLVTPMVLRNSGRVGSRRFRKREPVQQLLDWLFSCL